MNVAGRWPKELPPLSPEQKRISDDFMHYWHEVLPRRYGIVDRFNHEYAVKHAPPDFRRTLEIGAGTGEHLSYERLTEEQRSNYVAVDIRANMIETLARTHPEITSVVGDCQQRMDFEDGYFDRILAIHVLEHLPMLPDAVREMHRLCDRSKGVLSIVIPCEGSIAYTLARRISAQRIFEKRYKQSYRWFIEREHINRPFEILGEIGKFFTLKQQSFFPLPIPVEAVNLCIGATFVPKSAPSA